MKHTLSTLEAEIVKELHPLQIQMRARCVVPGVGPETAKLMLIGEAPGKDEDEQAEPFVGRAGQLLDKMLKDAGLNRADAYITNVVKCRPTETNGKFIKNRPPTDEEILYCKKWLWEEMQLIAPQVIVTLGAVPTKTLLQKFLKKPFSMGKVVGKVYQVPYTHSVIIPAWHPSYLLQHGKAFLEDSMQHYKLVYGILNHLTMKMPDGDFVDLREVHTQISDNQEVRM